MEKIEVQRESFTVTFDGGTASEHEIDVRTLANSLLAMKGAFEKMGVSKYGRQADVYMKVRGQFKATSFGVDLLMGCMAAVDAAKDTGPTLLASLVDLAQLTIWAKGEKVESRLAVDHSPGALLATNKDGQQNIYQIATLNLYANSNIRYEMQQMVAPLEKGGVDHMKISSPDLPQDTVIHKSDVPYFNLGQDGDDRESLTEMRLEIRTANFDGKPDRWRFYDGENDFSAAVEDTDFLEKVASKETRLASGDELLVLLKTVQSRPNKKLTTTRTVVEVREVIPFIPQA